MDTAANDRTALIQYRDDVVPAADSIARLYEAAQLHRPTNDVDRICRMYAGSNIVSTAWNRSELVGILRGWTDEALDGYICDLAVLPDFQRLGIGRELLQRVVASRPQVQFILRASKLATEYYKHIGWQKVENGWFLAREPWESM